MSYLFKSMTLLAILGSTPSHAVEFIPESLFRNSTVSSCAGVIVGGGVSLSGADLARERLVRFASQAKATSLSKKVIARADILSLGRTSNREVLGAKAIIGSDHIRRTLSEMARIKNQVESVLEYNNSSASFQPAYLVSLFGILALPFAAYTAVSMPDYSVIANSFLALGLPLIDQVPKYWLTNTNIVDQLAVKADSFMNSKTATVAHWSVSKSLRHDILSNFVSGESGRYNSDRLNVAIRRDRSPFLVNLISQTLLELNTLSHFMEEQRDELQIQLEKQEVDIDFFFQRTEGKEPSMIIVISVGIDNNA